jgi:hypothetical protein
MSDPACVRKAIAARRRGATLVEAAAAAGVHVATLCRWQAKDPALQEALDEARDEAPLKGPMPGPKLQVRWHRDCPLCRMRVVVRTARGGIRFWRCRRWPWCSWSSWRPRARPPGSFSGKTYTPGDSGERLVGIAVSAVADTKKEPLTIPVSGCLGVEPKGIEPSTSRMPFCWPCNASDADKGVATAPASGCTTGCTSEPENASAETLDQLATAARNLSPADRGRLAAMLGQGQAK